MFASYVHVLPLEFHAKSVALQMPAETSMRSPCIATPQSSPHGGPRGEPKLKEPNVKPNSSLSSTGVENEPPFEEWAVYNIELYVPTARRASFPLCTTSTSKPNRL